MVSEMEYWREQTITLSAHPGGWIYFEMAEAVSNRFEQQS